MIRTEIFAGFHNDKHGKTQQGHILLDVWHFGFIAETEDCAGWNLGRKQNLTDKINAEWDKYSNLPSRLPPELRQRHVKLYRKAMTMAREKGWDPELSEDG